MSSRVHDAKQGIRLFDLVPEEIIESWIRGEYLLGASRSAGYDYIGWSLFIRGFYSYIVQKKLGENIYQDHNKGFCIIDLQDGELAMYGIRTQSIDEKELELGHLRPGFFRSEFSKLILPLRSVGPQDPKGADIDRSARPTVYLGYRFYSVEKKEHSEHDSICRQKRDICIQALRFYEQEENRLSAFRDPESAEAKVARQSYQRRVYEYLIDRQLFDDHLWKIERIFDDFDRASKRDGRRNLYAVLQIALDPGGPADNDANLVAEYDRLPSPEREPMHGRVLFHRIDMLELTEPLLAPAAVSGACR